MSNFSVTILGCSSATPTADRHPSAQVVTIGDSKILIDCGEGTQNQMIKYHVKYNKIEYILISHLHGDHFLGLPGLMSTMSLNGRQKKLTLIGPLPLYQLIQDFLKLSETVLQYEVEFIATKTQELEEILTTDHFKLYSFPLQHRVPCTGFIVEENRDPRKIDVERCINHEIPIEYYPILKRGKDYHGLNGTIIKNEDLTIPSAKLKKYIYCSDTIYDESLVPHFTQAELLYHESTFAEAMLTRAQETWHSTAKQAGSIAFQAQVKKLIIGHFSARYSNLEELLKEAQTEFEQTALALEGETFTI